MGNYLKFTTIIGLEITEKQEEMVESKLSVVRSAETEKLYAGVTLSSQDEMSDIEECKHSFEELNKLAKKVKMIYEETFGAEIELDKIQLINLVEVY